MKKLLVNILCTLCVFVAAAQDKSVQEMRDEANRKYQEGSKRYDSENLESRRFSSIYYDAGLPEQLVSRRG